MFKRIADRKNTLAIDEISGTEIPQADMGSPLEMEVKSVDKKRSCFIFTWQMS